jgi:hypothetical protein
MPPSPSTTFPDEFKRRSATIDLSPLIQKTLTKHLHGLPYPVQFRNQRALEGWQHVLESVALGRQLWESFAEADFVCESGTQGLEQLLLAMIPRTKIIDAQRWAELINGVALHLSTNLMYERREGVLIEATPALETLLTHCDTDDAVPIGMLNFPHAAQYLRFGEHIARSQPADFDDADAVVDGVFCFVSTEPMQAGARAPVRRVQLIFIVKRQDCYSGLLNLEHRIDSADMLLSDWVRQMVDQIPNLPAAAHPRITELVGHVAKVFLYLNWKGARQVLRKDYSDAQVSLVLMGKKKQAKLSRRIATLYDRIVVGPDSLPDADVANGPDWATGQAALAHWQSGQFRIQAQGNGSRESKLIFVAPRLLQEIQPRDQAIETVLCRNALNHSV